MVLPLNEICKKNIDSGPQDESFLSELHMNEVFFNVTTSQNQFDGYNLFHLAQHSINSTNSFHATLIVDMNGNVIRSIDMIWPAEWINSTTILGRSISNSKAILYNFYTDKTTYLTFSSHHELEYNDRNKTIFALEEYHVPINGTDYRFDYVKEHRFDGTVVWTLDLRDFISYTQWCPLGDITDTAADVTHCNAVFFDPDEDVLYVNVRNVNTFYKIDHKTGEVIWALGEYGNFTMYDRYGSPRDALFYHAHSLEKTDENTFILFDNDYHNQTDPFDEKSRILEISINEDTMTANESWSWTAPDGYYSSIYGDADRLPNGNRLGAFGTDTHGNLTTIGGRLVEVDNDGNIVWEMNFPESDSFRYKCPGVDRFRFAPILSSPSDIEQIEPNVTITWDTWYNYRPKRNMTGTFEVHLNGELVDTGPVTFDKYWRPVYLTKTIPGLSVGNNTIKLIVFDEAGHQTSDEVIVSRPEYYIHHTEISEYELGDIAYRNFTWYGESMEPYSCNISINSVPTLSTIWDGRNITLDLETFITGSNEINITLYNLLGVIHSESSFVLVHPSEPPDISSSQGDNVEITFTDPISLSWNISDYAPKEWRIMMNGTIVSWDEWSDREFHVEYVPPLLFEGVYNLTLVAMDRVGLSSMYQTTVTVNPSLIPIILSKPTNMTLLWGGPETTLVWDVYYGTTWTIWRNNTFLASGDVEGNHASFTIKDWLHQKWQLGMNNITLQVFNLEESSYSTTWIEIVLVIADPYADSVVMARSEAYLFGENAIGAPDGNYSVIYVDYMNGYLTLDMGFGEEIVDEEGDDFQVIVGAGGNYSVYVGNDLASQFAFVGRTSGNSSYDIGASDLALARYVRIEYYSDNDIRLDSIVAIHINQEMIDDDPPQLSDVRDFSVFANISEVTLAWDAYDLTPWSYEIYVNGSLEQFEIWRGQEIDFDFSPQGVGAWNITITVRDAFGHKTSDSVIISVLEDSPETTTPVISPDSTLYSIAILCGVLSIAVLLPIGYWLHNKRRA
jgi:hypothetical protein